MSSEFLVENHFELSGRGAFVMGHIRAGTISVGDRAIHDGKAIIVSAVEFADNVATHEYWVCLGFSAVASKSELVNTFPRGSVIRLEAAV